MKNIVFGIVYEAQRNMYFVQMLGSVVKYRRRENEE